MLICSYPIQAADETIIYAKEDNKQKFVWLDVDNKTTLKKCRNSVQGRLFIADERGMVLPSCSFIGRRALFSYRARYDVIEFSNCHIEERSEAEFFCAVWKRNGVIPCSITEQCTSSYVLTVLEHSHIQSDIMACTVL